MPGPVAHGLYALSYLRVRPGERNETEFLRGTEFPDIRTLAGLSRDLTHFTGLTLHDVAGEPDDWRAGLMLHSVMDDAWTQYISQFGLVPGRAQDEPTWLALKIAEDIALTSGVSEAQKGSFRAACSAEVLPLEREAVADEQVLRLWNQWIEWKLTVTFEESTWLAWSQKLGFEAEFIHNALMMSQHIGADPVWQKRLVHLQTELGYR